MTATFATHAFTYDQPRVVITILLTDRNLNTSFVLAGRGTQSYTTTYSDYSDTLNSTLLCYQDLVWSHFIC